MKEEEAKQKWCPHSRVTSPNASFNKVEGGYIPKVEGGYIPKAALCVASLCMMWLPDRTSTGAVNPNSGDCGLKNK